LHYLSAPAFLRQRIIARGDQGSVNDQNRRMLVAASPDQRLADLAIILEKDIEVPMRDGARLRADVFRPQSQGKYPAILNLGPYQKDKLWVTPPNLEEQPNPFMNWETVNPESWVP